jgi:signal transduction histidine kinase
LAIELAARAADRPVQRSAASDIVVAVLFPVIGCVVLRREPRNLTGWILVSGSLVGVSVLAHQWAYDAGVVRPGHLPLGGLATWLAAWTYWPHWLQPTLLPVLFPAGHPPSDRWRRFVRGVLVVVALGVVATMVKSDADVEGMGLDNPLGIDALGPVPIFLQAGSVLLLGVIASPIAIVGLARRQRRTDGIERTQLQWLLLGFATCLALGVLSEVFEGAGDLLFSLGFAAIPVSIAVAILRHGLFDIDVVVNRTIVYALLTGASVVGYFALVALAGRYTSGSESAYGPYVAAIVVALAASARTQLQRLVDRRLFGARRDPISVVRQVTSSTASAEHPLQALADTVRESLRLPFVQVLAEDGEPLATSGQPVAGTHVFPVVERGRQIAVLVVGSRSRGERLRSEEQSALGEVARQAGTMLNTAALTAGLQEAYERTVMAREEERKRLRRDLHDGVGPALAGMALQLDSLAGKLHDDADLAVRAEGLRDRLRGTVGEVRRIVDGLRPAAVDELGLAGALRALGSDDSAVRVVVEVDLPTALPAAVEVAAYRIGAEAVTNAVRHSGASIVTLRSTAVGDALRLEVHDNGHGFGAEATAGVGLESLHDRAIEVGGNLVVESQLGGGTRVTATLPLTMEAS